MATEISDWDELISNSDTDAEIVWTGGDLDFNEIQPHGFTETITFKAKSIDFSGATFKNIRSYAQTAFLFNKGEYRNLNIIDMIFNSISTNTAYYLTGDNIVFYNCVFTCEIVPARETKICTPHLNTSVKLFSCGFNIRAVSNDYAVRFDDTVDHAVLYADCRFIFDITQNGKQIFYKSHIVNCLISGKFDNVSGENISISTSKVMGTNVFNLSSNAKLEYTSPKLSLYNSDLATFEQNDNIIACTAEELKNPEILRKKGFPIAVVGT